MSLPLLLAQTQRIYARGVKDLLCNPRYNVMSKSLDLEKWDEPVRAFSDPAHATNPVYGV